MKLILLTRGLVAIVDDCDYARLSRIKWQVSSSGNSFYAVHNDAKNRKTAIFMHRLTIYAPSGKQVDHINGDTLDNRRHDLRLASPPQNAHNCKVARKNNTSGFKGVSFNKPRGRWIAYIKVRGKKHNLGYFKTPEEAAREYDRAARLAFGQFARINFPIPGFQCLQDRPPKFSPIVVEARILNGEEHPSAKLSNRQVRAIRSTFKSSSSQSLAEMFNVSMTTIWSIRNGKGYQSV